MVHFPNNQFYEAPMRLNALILLPLMLIGIGVAWYHRGKRHGWRPNVMVAQALLITCMTLVVAITWFPINLFPVGHAVYANGFGRQAMMINWQLADLKNTLPIQIIGNSLLLSPLGFFSPMLWPSQRRLLRALPVWLLTTLAIELGQWLMNWFYLSNRQVDLNDVILNVAGAGLGYLGWWLIHQLVVTKVKRSY